MRAFLRRFAWLVVPLVLVGAGIAWMATRPLAVPVLTPQSNVAAELFGLGNLDAERLSHAGFDVGGTVAEMRVRVGDRVKVGDVVARLDTSLEELRVAAASDAQAFAEASARQAEAHAASSAANVTLKRQVADRTRELETRNAGTAAAAQDARADLLVAEAQSVESQRAVDVAQSSAKQARTALAQEKELLAHYFLKAPFDAIVTERQAVEGSVVQPGVPVVTLAGADSIRVLTFISEGQSGAVTPGQTASITLRSRPGEIFPGHVDRIQPASDATTEERTVSVVLDHPPETLFLAEQAQVQITVGTVARALLVPERAVRDRDNGAGTIWVVENGRLAERRVTFGMRLEDGRLEILSPLPEGVRAVADRLTGVAVGQAVRIVEP